jgi:hypothetical protein
MRDLVWTPPVVGGSLIKSIKPVDTSVGTSVLTGVIKSETDEKSDDCAMRGV